MNLKKTPEMINKINFETKPFFYSDKGIYFVRRNKSAKKIICAE